MESHDSRSELEELRFRLEEAEETLRSIRHGEVDALIVDDDGGERVYTLQGADYPYRIMIESMQQGAVSLSSDGTILYSNPCFSEMMLLNAEKLLGVSIFSCFPPPMHQRIRDMLTKGCFEKSQGEFQLLTAAQTLLPIFVALAPTTLQKSISVCMVVTDLTEQKQHESLMETSRRKDEFLAMLAHELRNPLAPIQNAVSILGLEGVSNSAVTKSREIIQRQLNQLTHLVDDLLDVSRITLGKVNLEKKRVSLASIILRAVETTRPAFDLRHHDLRISLPPADAEIEADPIRMSQVFGNLLLNAAKYTSEGGQISLTSTREGSWTVVRIKDSGVGMPPDLLSRVFDLFIQGDRSLARSEGGLGIGLTLVQRLIALHDGTVEAFSEGVGKGSEFVIRIPVATELRNASTSPTEDITRFQGDNMSRRILIVEDNKDGADSLAVLLRMSGHQVEIAYDGRDAVELAHAFAPQFVLLDIGLPGMSGYEIARMFKQLPRFTSVVLIAMTGYGSEEDRRRTSEAGFHHHLVKPLNPAHLENLLRQRP